MNTALSVAAGCFVLTLSFVWAYAMCHCMSYGPPHYPALCKRTKNVVTQFEQFHSNTSAAFSRVASPFVELLNHKDRFVCFSEGPKVPLWTMCKVFCAACGASAPLGSFSQLCPCQKGNTIRPQSCLVYLVEANSNFLDTPSVWPHLAFAMRFLMVHQSEELGLRKLQGFWIFSRNFFYNTCSQIVPTISLDVGNCRQSTFLVLRALLF